MISAIGDKSELTSYRVLLVTVRDKVATLGRVSFRILFNAFYSYTVPAPKGFENARVAPKATYFDAQLGEFILKFDQVQTAQSSSAALLEFRQSTYETGARKFEVLHNRQFPQWVPSSLVSQA